MSTLILLSNDDGINSEGINVAKEALKLLGTVYVVAPDRDQSAVSHSLSLYRPLRIHEEAKNIYSVDGTPTDCINLAVNGILKNKNINLVISGINKGENLGDDITYSGTVSAAMEGTLLGIPSISISSVGKDNFDFTSASLYLQKIAKQVLLNRLPKGTFLNVNVPSLSKSKPKGIKITIQGKRIYGDPIVEKVDPRGRKYYWIGGFDLGYEKIDNSDIIVVKEGFVSITPIRLDLTDYNSIDKIKNYFE